MFQIYIQDDEEGKKTCVVVSPKIYQLFAAPAEIEATGKKEFLTESAFFSFFKIVYAIHVHSTVQRTVHILHWVTDWGTLQHTSHRREITYIVTVLLPSMVREGLWWWWRSGGGGQTEIYLPLLGRRDTAHHNQPAGVGRNPGRVCTVQCASRRLVKCLFS